MPVTPTPVQLLTDDGVRVEGSHEPADDDSRELAFVVAHGFTGSWRRPAVRQIARWLTPFGGVVGFDFRGHGGSGGRSTVGDREVLDLRSAVGWARWLGYRRVATLGWSMGASVVVRHAAADGGVEAVAAISGPAWWYYRGTPPMRLLHLGVEHPLGRLVLRHGFHTRINPVPWGQGRPMPSSPVEAAPAIAPIPLLVVHGDADHYFPVEHGRALYEAAREPKVLWIEPGFGHAEGAATRGLVRRIAVQLRQWAVLDRAGEGPGEGRERAG